MKYLFFFLIILVSFSCSNLRNANSIESIYIDNESRLDVEFVSRNFASYCKNQGIQINTKEGGKDQLKIIISDTAQFSGKHNFPAESYYISSSGKNEVSIVAADKRALIYGFQSLAEQLFIQNTSVNKIDLFEKPDYSFRTIKFNLPWNSYREHESLQLHAETLRDLDFWESFLDMMSKNRFNTLTLWSVHPWTYMIRPEKYPEACPFDDKELAKWQNYWHSLFAMASERGIKVFMVNWNIFVSREFSKAHGVAEYSQHLDTHYNGYGDYSELVQQYNKDVVRQVLAEYPELKGIGVSQNERMKGPDVTEEQWQQWIVDTYFDIVHEAQPEREFILRGHTHPAPELTRAAIENNTDKLPSKVWVPLKYNWSHGHAQSQLFYIHGGSDSDVWWNPVPEDYKVIFTIRNEDFFILRWGSPSFIRELVNFNKPNEAVGGFIVGSETYIPATDYITKLGRHKTWDYAFERQWLFYKLWGRLMYNSETPDDIFINAFNRKYDIAYGNELYRAFELASQMPLQLASYFGATWDFTLYSEGFMSGYPPWRGEKWEGHSPLLSVEDIIGANPIDPSWLNVAEYVRFIQQGKDTTDRKTPLEIAKEMKESGSKALEIVDSIEPSNLTLQHEIADIKAWSYLSLYFEKKLRGCIAFEKFRVTKNSEFQDEAVAQLEEALGYWRKLIEVTNPYFDEIPLLHLKDNSISASFEETIDKFSWKALLPFVERDIEYVKNCVPR